MALLKLGALITSASGKVGGQTITNGAQGTTLKNNGNNKKSASIRQAKQRSISAAALQYWRTLSPLEKDKFATAAPLFKPINRLKQPFTYTAYQVFMLQQQNALHYKGVYLTDARPPYSFSSRTASVVGTAGPTITVTCAGLTSNEDLIILAGLQINNGYGTPYKYLKEIAVIDNTTAAAGYNCATDYQNIFGPINTAASIFFAFKQYAIADHQTSDFFSPQWCTF